MQSRAFSFSVSSFLGLRQTCSETDRAMSAKLAMRLISSNEEIGWIVMRGNSLGGISRGFQGGFINWVFGTRADP